MPSSLSEKATDENLKLGPDDASSIAPTATNTEAAKSTSAIASSGPKMQEPHHVSNVRFVLIFLSLMLTVFLFALDQLIVATAIPKITSEFHSLTQISWIANGFFVTLLSFNLAFAQWSSIFPAKHVSLFAIATFELGSLLCGVAPNMPVLILGRAVAGMGGSGIFNSALMIITELTTMQERAKLFGFFGVNFAIASVTGPLIGGAFTDHITWRWAFYINLPIGGLAFFLIAFLVPHLPPYGHSDSYQGYGRHMLGQLARCDCVGIAIILSWGIVSTLFMQEGGVTKHWQNASIIVEVIMIPVLLALFVAWEFYMGDKAMLPMILFKRPLIVSAVIVAICTQGPFMALVQYLAEGYQAVYHTSATKAGILLLPLIIVNVLVLISAGRFVAATGRPWPLMVAGPAIMCIGCGLLYSVNATDSKSYPMGYSAVIGIGCGMVLQNVIVVAQYTFSKEPRYVAVGTGAVTFGGFVGRLYVIGIAGSIFENMIPVNLHKYAPSLSADLVKQVQDNANAVWTVVPDDQRGPVLVAYTKTLGAVYLLGVPLTIIGFFAALSMGNIKMDLKKAPAAAPKKDVEAAASTSETEAIEDEKVPVDQVAVVPPEGAELEAAVLEGSEGKVETTRA